MKEICVNLCESVDKQQSGNRTQVIELSGRTTDYVYDDQYRLTSETISNSPDGIIGTVSYTLDAVGNRLARNSSVISLDSTTNSFNENDHLDTEVYDKSGNVISGSSYSDTYDFVGRLIRREKTNGTIIDLVYNADGVRVSKTVDGLSTDYLTCSNNLRGYAQVLEELDSIGLVQKAYTYGLDLISQTRISGADTETHYYLYDGHGSVKSLVDELGEIAVDYQYDAFGNLLSEIQYGVTNVANSYRFTGEQFDADLEQYYLRARYFNQDTGRFNRVDPFSGNINDPVSLHRYLGLSANPVMFVDPSGEISIASLGAVGSIVGILSSISTPSFKTINSAFRNNVNALAAQLGVVVPFTALKNVNWLKFWVGLFNLGNATRKFVMGVQSLVLGTLFLPAPQFAAAFYAYAAYNFIGSAGAFKRATIQLYESTMEETAVDMSWRNLLGVLPFGQLYDDPDENLESVLEEVKRMKTAEIIKQVFSFL